MAALFVGRALGLWDDFAAATALEMPKSVVAAGDGLELALQSFGVLCTASGAAFQHCKNWETGAGMESFGHPRELARCQSVGCTCPREAGTVLVGLKNRGLASCKTLGASKPAAHCQSAAAAAAIFYLRLILDSQH